MLLLFSGLYIQSSPFSLTDLHVLENRRNAVNEATSGPFRLVGEAYLHGIVDGEVMRDERFEDEIIVLR